MSLCYAVEINLAKVPDGHFVEIKQSLKNKYRQRQQLSNTWSSVSRRVVVVAVFLILQFLFVRRDLSTWRTPNRNFLGNIKSDVG